MKGKGTTHAWIWHFYLSQKKVDVYHVVSPHLSEPLPISPEFALPIPFRVVPFATAGASRSDDGLHRKQYEASEGSYSTSACSSFAMVLLQSAGVLRHRN